MVMKFDLSELVKRSVGTTEEEKISYEEIDLRVTSKKVVFDEVEIGSKVYRGIIAPLDAATGEQEIIHRQLVYTAGIMALGLVPDLGERIVEKLGDNIGKLRKRRTDMFIGAAWKTWLVQAIFESWVDGMRERNRE